MMRRFSTQLALQQIKNDIVEQPMEFLCKGIFLTTNKKSWHSRHISSTKLVCFMNNCYFFTDDCGKVWYYHTFLRLKM
jgi:hypothetical protein